MSTKTWNVVLKDDPSVVYAIRYVQAEAQKWIDINAVEYAREGYFEDKSLTADSFTVLRGA